MDSGDIVDPTGSSGLHKASSKAHGGTDGRIGNTEGILMQSVLLSDYDGDNTDDNNNADEQENLNPNGYLTGSTLVGQKLGSPLFSSGTEVFRGLTS